MSNSTAFLKRRHPVLKATLDYCLKRVELLIVAAVIGGGSFALHNSNSGKIQSLERDPESFGTNWVGQAMADQHREIYENRDALVDLSNRVTHLERKK